MGGSKVPSMVHACCKVRPKGIHCRGPEGVLPHERRLSFHRQIPWHGNVRTSTLRKSLFMPCKWLYMSIDKDTLITIKLTMPWWRFALFLQDAIICLTATREKYYLPISYAYYPKGHWWVRHTEHTPVDTKINILESEGKCSSSSGKSTKRASQFDM